MPITVTETAIPEVKIVTPKRFGDHRGYFCEVFSARDFAAAGLPAEFVQDNHSLSAEENTLRGLHFQSPPAAQGKLVRCVAGAILDVAVDIRHGSPTFGQHVAVTLSAENGQQLWVPVGFAHGFRTMASGTEVNYKTTAYYAPEYDSGFHWDDPDIGVDWGLGGATPILSAKDQALPKFRELPAIFTYPA